MFYYKFFKSFLNFYNFYGSKPSLDQNNFDYIKFSNFTSENFLFYFFSNNLRYAVNSSSLYDLEYKRKSHSYHIITSYRAAYHEVTNYYLPYHLSEVFFYAFKNIDYFWSYLPFYFIFVVSFFNLFLLFIFFLNKSSYILYFLYNSFGFIQIKIFSFSFYFIEFFPSDLYIFILFYFNIIFYWALLVWSFYKFVTVVQYEIICRYIYNYNIDRQYILGSILFILSEFMLFFSFFWAFFYSSLSPSIFVGYCWPPVNIVVLNPWHIPFLNTLILVISGVTVNWFFFTLQRLSFIKSRSFWKEGKSFITSFFFIYYTVFDFFLYFFLNYSRRLYYYSLDIELFAWFYNFLRHFFFLLKLIYLNYLLKFNYFFSCFYIYPWLSNYFFDKPVFYYYFLNKMVLRDLYLIFLHYVYYLLNYIIEFDYYNIYKFFLSTIDKFFLYKLYISKSLEDIYISLTLTIYLGCLFLGFQYCEYKYYATFGLDNIYGTVFYLLTSLHGAHVYVGLSLLLICYSFLTNFDFSKSNINTNVYSNLFLFFSVWYWHFVDVIWLFLFVVVYVWGS